MFLKTQLDAGVRCALFGARFRYNLEGVRVQSYISIGNIVVLVLAVSYFALVYLGQSIKLKMLAERIFIVSKRFFGVPSFFTNESIIV